MFKNIFPYLNRLVYRGETASHQVEAQAVAEISKKSLKSEARELSKGIATFAEGILDNINEERRNLQLKPLKDYNDIKKNYKDKTILKIMADLGAAQKSLHSAAKKRTIARKLLDDVRSSIDNANTRYQGYREINSHLAVQALFGASIDVKDIPKAAPKEVKEVPWENVLWAKVEQLINDLDKAPAKKQDAIQRKILAQLGRVAKDRPKRFSQSIVDTKGKRHWLTVEKAAGPGTDAYKLTLNNKTVYAGCSAKDFPKRRA